MCALEKLWETSWVQIILWSWRLPKYFTTTLGSINKDRTCRKREAISLFCSFLSDSTFKEKSKWREVCLEDSHQACKGTWNHSDIELIKENILENELLSLEKRLGVSVCVCVCVCGCVCVGVCVCVCVRARAPLTKVVRGRKDLSPTLRILKG